MPRFIWTEKDKQHLVMANKDEAESSLKLFKEKDGKKKKRNKSK